MTCCFEGLEALAIAMADAKGMAQPSSRADQQPGTAAKSCFCAKSETPLLPKLPSWLSMEMAAALQVSRFIESSLACLLYPIDGFKTDVVRLTLRCLVHKVLASGPDSS